MNDELRERLAPVLLGAFWSYQEMNTQEAVAWGNLGAWLADQALAEIEAAGYSVVKTEELEGYRHLWRVMVADAAVRDAMPEWMHP